MDLEFWVADLVGEVASIGDYFFDFSDIRYDIDSNQPVGKILKWQDESIENHFKKKKTKINYKTYCLMNKKD